MEKPATNVLISFLKKYRLWIFISALVLIVIILSIVLISCINRSKPVEDMSSQAMMERIKSAEVTVGEDQELQDFFSDYYQAYSSGNTSEIEAMYTDASKSQVTANAADLISAVDGITVYSLPGMNDNERAVFVYYEITFNNIATKAPAVDSFYLVRDAKSGSWKIDSDMFTDESMITYLTLASMREPIRTLLSDTEASLQTALSQDSDLNSLYILMSSMASQNQDSASSGETETTNTTKSELSTDLFD